jgi:hypothetical protein
MTANVSLTITRLHVSARSRREVSARSMHRVGHSLGDPMHASVLDRTMQQMNDCRAVAGRLGCAITNSKKSEPAFRSNQIKEGKRKLNAARAGAETSGAARHTRRGQAGRFSAAPIRSLAIAHRAVPQPNCTLGNSTEKPPASILFILFERIVP